ncbi:chemotaxis protein CheD [candidate division WOR-3 bacterium]|nr:chemotaxis protein CheD [candidate division WOR-3 bacterium]
MKKANKILVKTGQYKVANNSHTLITHGLGSCVALTLYDEEKKIGGMLHYILPENPNNMKKAKYADTGIELMLKKMKEGGANSSRLKAKLAGGAVMFGSLLKDVENSIGNRNVRMAREILNGFGITITGEDVGGDYGRSVTFSLSTGMVRINSYVKGEKTF